MAVVLNREGVRMSPLVFWWLSFLTLGLSMRSGDPFLSTVGLVGSFGATICLAVGVVRYIRQAA